MPVQPVVRIEDAPRGVGPDGAAADEVGRQGRADELADVAAREAVDLLGEETGRLRRLRDLLRVGRAVPLAGGEQALARTPRPPVGGQGVVQGLHHQADDRALGPAAVGQRPQQLHRVQRAAGREGHRPRRPRPHRHLQDGQQAHRVGALAVADGLDVGVGVGVDGRGDGHAPGEVHPVRPVRPVRPVGAGARLAVAPVGGLRAHQRLGVGPGQRPESGRDAGQQPPVPHRVQQRLRAVRTGGDHHVLGPQHPGARPARPARRAPGVGGDGHDAVAPVAVLGDGDDRRHGVDHRAGALGEVQVVLGEGVLGAVPAARHALAALDARPPGRPRAPEVGVRGLLARARPRRAVGVLTVAEEDPDRRAVEGLPHAHPFGRRLQVDVRGGRRRVEPYAQHAARLLVVRRELVLPVGDPGPLRVVEERLGGYVEGVGVIEGAAAHAGAGQHHHVAEQVDALDAVEA